MARSYEGSRARLKQVIRKALRGEELVLSTIGGSGAFSHAPSLTLLCDTDHASRAVVTGGHGVSRHEIWFSLFGEWFEGFMQPERDERIGYVKVNGAVPGTRASPVLCCQTVAKIPIPTLSNRQRLL